MKNYLKKIGSNRRLTAGKLAIDFKNPWNYLAEMPAEARGEASSEATNRFWWTDGDLNPRPPRCKRGALPTELSARFYCGLLYLKRGDKTHSIKPPIILVIIKKPIKIASRPTNL